MPPLTTSPQLTGYSLDETRHSVVFKRHLAVSVEQAFALWTQPAHVAHWWDPSDEPLRECSIDLRVGGQLRFVNAGREGPPPFVGRYLEITPPTRLVFEAMGATGTVSIKPSGKGSEIEVEIRAPNAEALKALVHVGVAAGTAKTLDNLSAYAGLHPTISTNEK
jgi:uncharacterized protein YndB with AHSA1/START domain